MECRPIFVLAGLLAASLAVADGAYRWVDKDGVVHYSDVPPDESAEVVNISEYSRTTGVRISPQTSRTSDEEQPAEQEAFRYESLAVTSPGPEETLWNIEGVLNVSLALTPALQQGHQVRVYFDGGAPTTVTGSNFQIDNVFRGVHNIQAEVIDATGRLMIRSKPNRFYVQQNTVIARPGT